MPPRKKLKNHEILKNSPSHHERIQHPALLRIRWTQSEPCFFLVRFTSLRRMHWNTVLGRVSVPSQPESGIGAVARCNFHSPASCVLQLGGDIEAWTSKTPSKGWRNHPWKVRWHSGCLPCVRRSSDTRTPSVQTLPLT